MPKLRDYTCDCGTRFEFLHMAPEDPAACPSCGVFATDKDEMLGGKSCKVIMPMSMDSLKRKAGYVHTHADRPAEKNYVSVPRTGETK